MPLRSPQGHPDPQAVLSEWFATYAARQQPVLIRLAREPRRTLAAAIALHRLPVETVAPTDSSDGRAIAGALARGLLPRLLLRGATAALAVPPDPSTYLRGPSRKVLRQYIRSAHRKGLTIDEVAHADREALLTLADARERTNPRDAFRTIAPDNDDMLRLRLWLVARDTEGVPVLLTVVAVDGSSAVLRYHRTLVDSPESSLARYLAMPELLARLAALGATMLFERSQPQWLPEGLRLFQRRTGFELVRVRLRPRAATGGPADRSEDRQQARQ